LNRINIALLALLSSGVASADTFLDFIRSYDLNDYALGAAVTVSESPYVGGENSVFAYPYLTSFRDAAFTDDWLLISEGDLGLRWVNDADWELGIVGRMQTLGLGNSTSDAVLGLDDRNWSIEIAPLVGFRGWPVHVALRSYFEVLGRHGGNQTELAFRLPREYDWGFFIPTITGIYRDADYTNYYFGVSEAEARPVRPAYTPGSSTSSEVSLRLGVALTDRWLLSGTLRMEFLGDAITASPIVDQESIWSANIGLAYNADIFQPRVSAIGGKYQPQFEMRIAWFSANSDAKVIYNNANGDPGDEIDLEDLLGIEDRENILQFDAIYRFNDFHRIEVSYHSLSRTGTTLLSREISFGDRTFAEGTELATRFDTELLRLGYGYSLMNDAQKELGVTAGVHVSNNTTDVTAMPSGERERSNVSTPLPVIGAFGSVALGPRSSLAAKLQLFGMQYDRLEGAMVFGNLEWQRRLTENVSIGLGYNAYYSRLRSREDEGRGRLETLHHGPMVFVTTGF
jgi:outer membrane scaffolding protein for murein synthesis (MipA/OmpV family)